MPLERMKSSWSVLPRPWRSSVVVLSVIFTTEWALMVVIPRMFPAASAGFNAALDSALLTLIVSPVLWWMLVRPLKRAAELRSHFLADLFSTIEDERRRIANELHDGVGQTLTLLISGLRSLSAGSVSVEVKQREIELCELARRALADTKELALGLRPSLLDDFGLSAAIERVAAEVEEHHQMRVVVDVQAMSGKRLPDRCETAVFRIFQEAMANIVEHSQASVASIRLTREPQQIVLSVADNGRGIDAAIAARPPGAGGHLGLVGMQERAALLGGEVVIESAGGSGTRITVAIPV